MAETETRELKAKGKAEVPAPTEQMRPGPAFTPDVDIFETEKEIILLADIPGVKTKDLKIDLHDNLLSLSGETESPQGPDEVDVFREYQTGRYLREFTLSEVIDQTGIEAVLKDGVLRLSLPKVEAATPRKIAVKGG